MKCPSCASSLRFDIASQKLHCDYCSSSFDPYLFDKVEKDAELQKDLEESRPGDTGLYETAVWICPDCGAELTYTDDTDVTTVCAYCGGRNILFERIRGQRRPDSIVPFAVTKEDCKKAYTARARRAFLSPGSLHSKGQVESFRGIYMPYFEYYAALNGDLKFEAEELAGTNKEGTVYNVTEYVGHVDGKVLGNSHDASVRFADDISENLGEFGDPKPFTPGYLSGFYAETNDVDQQTFLPGEAVVEAKIREAVVRELSEKTTPYGVSIGKVDAESIQIDHKKIRAERTLYPVWFMSRRMGNGKLTYAAVNGSTGKIAADFPLSFLRVLLFALAASGVFFLFFNLVGLMPRPVPSLGIAMLLFMLGVFFNSLAVEKRLLRLYDVGRDAKSRGYEKLWKYLVIRMALCGVFIISLFSLLAGSSNSIWRACISVGRPLFVGNQILSMCLTFRLLREIDLEQTHLSYQDLRFGRFVAIINFLLPGLFSLCSWVVLVADVRNEVYYRMAVANAVCFMLLFFFTVPVINYFSYRRPPQFNKKGGDDRAN